MYTILGNSNVELCKDVGKLHIPKIAQKLISEKTFLFLDLRISKNILQVGKAKVSKFGVDAYPFRTESIFATEQKTIVLCFLKHVSFH